MELKKNYSEQAELLIFRKSSPSLGILPPGSGGGAERRGPHAASLPRARWQPAVFLYHIRRQGAHIPAQPRIKTQGAGRPILSLAGQLWPFAEPNPGPCRCQLPTCKAEAGGSQEELHGHLAVRQPRLFLGRGDPLCLPGAFEGRGSHVGGAGFHCGRSSCPPS